MGKCIDIIILTMNKNERVLRQFEMLRSQTLQANKIIIMNTLSDENEKSKMSDILKNKKNKVEEHIVYKKDFSHGKTRNMAVSFSSADYILFMTDDAVPYDNTLIEDLYSAFEEDSRSSIKSNIAISYARQIAYDNASFIETKIREFNYGERSIIKDIGTEKLYGIKNYFASNVCCMYDKSVFDLLGGFDEKMPFNEDEVFAYKAIHNGYSVYYNSSAIVYHSHNFTFKEQYERNKLVGMSQKMHDEIFSHVKSENEGLKLVKYITIESIKKFRIMDLIKFYIECIFRYKGYVDGKNV